MKVVLEKAWNMIYGVFENFDWITEGYFFNFLP